MNMNDPEYQESLNKQQMYEREQLKKVKFNIISPDGFPFNVEPFEAVEPMVEDVAKKEFEKIKERYKRQGYYSSNHGRILLEDLEDECWIDFVEE